MTTNSTTMSANSQAFALANILSEFCAYHDIKINSTDLVSFADRLTLDIQKRDAAKDATIKQLREALIAAKPWMGHSLTMNEIESMMLVCVKIKEALRATEGV